ncbi:MAG TPA: hypothetical protein VHV52_11635 [Gaiellaceae bacterium]|jgi:hypothetical protein|nr:hypothetical protein [Gaiellaceae bacterium]
MRRTALLLLLLAASLACAFTQNARAGGGNYTFVGGTPAERAQVVAALNASSFSWGLIPQTITVNIGPFGTSYASYGAVFLDASLLDSGEFSWGVVQHEFGHEVDFFLLDSAKRATLQQALGGKDWCYEVAGLQHADHACERFASELAWAYWPSPQNSMRPTSQDNEAGGMPPAAFRALLAQLIGAPNTVQQPTTVKAFAPATTSTAPAKPKAKPKRVK